MPQGVAAHGDKYCKPNALVWFHCDVAQSQDLDGLQGMGSAYGHAVGINDHGSYVL